MRSPFPHPRASQKGFSLVELLTVIVIIGILTGAAVSGVSLIGARNFSGQSAQLTDILERTREYAVANNTYTWVAFYASASNGTTPATLYVATIASVDGTSHILQDGTALGSVGAWSNNMATAPASYQMLDKVASFPQVSLSHGGTYNTQLPKLPTVSQLTDLLASTTPTFSINVPNLGSESFASSIEFTPSGEAKVQAAPTQAIEFDLAQVHGATTSSTMVSAIRINGFTGQAQAYQP